MISFTNGIKNSDLVQLQDISIKLDFNNAIQPSIEVDEFDFVNETALQIQNWIKSNGVFTGLPQKITLNDGSVVFDGFIDFTDNFQVIHSNKIKAKLKQNSIQDLKTKMSGVTTTYLLDKGFVTKKDYETILTVTNKEQNGVELAMLQLTLFLVTKELKDLTKKAKEDLAEFIAIFTSGPVSFSSALLMKATKLLLNLAYYAFLVVKWLQLIDALLGYFIDIPRKNKCISLKKLFEAYLKAFDLKLETSLPLENYYILPSLGWEVLPKIKSSLIKRKIKIGVPTHSDDPCYTGIELLELLEKMFNAKFSVLSGVVQCHTENSNFWKKGSGYVMPSVLKEDYTLNINDLSQTWYTKFETDIKDEWTIKLYNGTAYEQITSVKNKVNSFNLLKNYDEIRIPLALGNRKNFTSDVELMLMELGSAVDKLIKWLGGSSNIKSKIEKNLGALMISGDIHGKAKILYLKNGAIPNNHREYLSAKYLFETYHLDKSFVKNNYYGQEYEYKSVIPFSIDDYKKVKNNQYFKTFEGENARFISIEWFPELDRASCVYRVRKPYDKNLVEKNIDPEDLK